MEALHRQVVKVFNFVNKKFVDLEANGNFVALISNVVL